MMFLLSVIGMWKGLPGPIRRLVEYAAIAGLLLWGFRVFWLNPHDDKVATRERMKVTEEIRKAAEEKWQLKYRDLEDRNKTLQLRAEELQDATDALARSRENIVAGLNNTLAHIRIIGASNHAQDQNIPDYMLDTVLRDVSNSLECAKPGNASKPGCPAINSAGEKADTRSAP